MILCVTLNPCLDKTLTVPPWSPGENVRASGLREVVGGKGNNVARALARLGRAGVRPVNPFGGAVGEHCARLLAADDGLDPIVVATAAPTRVITTVRTGESAEQTAFFDPDPRIGAEEATALSRAVEEALDGGDVEALTLSGSSPASATNHLFGELIALAQARAVPTFLDTYGAALDAIWGFWPGTIQLNRREVAQHLGVERAEDADVVRLLDRWSRHGVTCGVVTDGPGAVLARVGEALYRVTPPEVEVANPIGSGDCLLAGLVDGRLRGLAAPELLRRAVACATTNATTWDAGRIDPERVEQLDAEVDVEEVESDARRPEVRPGLRRGIARTGRR